MAIGALATLCMGSAGCATNLSQLQTAQTLRPGQVRVDAGLGAYVPTAQLARAVGVAASAAQRLLDAENGKVPPPTEAEQREALEAALALALFPPGTVTQLSLRYGFVENLDAGLRWSSSGWRLDARYRFIGQDVRAPPGLSFRAATDFHLAGIVGIERHTFGGLLFDLYAYLKSISELFRFVELDDPSRWDFDFALVASWNVSDLLQPYVSARYRVGTYAVPSILTLDLPDGSQLVTREDLSGTLHYLGATLGLAGGYRWVYLYLELTVVQAVSQPVILGEPADLGGLTLYPVVGLSLEL
ncbi:MAG: hypothetical protein D6729_00400 [Deltaproteobacteria bacterium]|nr:MAG: hypothetical protein D6729_00400 [Deltaproteobacteria bacterium]